ncbi:MAG: AAA family ATPase [Gemmatimonadales bacterium]|nr:AAA family ATPase [Gemmatimonadales bacterium]
MPFKQGRHSCATAFSEIRKIFGKAALVTQGSTVRFTCPTLEVDLDVLDAGAVVGPNGEALLEVDGFLRGFDVDDSPDFGLWKEREHTRRLPAVQAGLLTLIDHGRRRGAHEEILRWADRLLDLDPFAEDGVRAKMEALALSGDRITAVRVFDDWKSQVTEDLRAAPSAALEAMAMELRRNVWIWRSGRPAHTATATQSSVRLFVGRVDEYRALYEKWEAARTFKPQIVVLEGDSGVGKTTLAQRLLSAAELEGASFARIQCNSEERRLPFSAISSLAVALSNRPGAATTTPAALAEIAKFAPDIRTRFPTLPASSDTEGDLARLRFADSVLELLNSVLEERPTLLVIDNAHFLDEASDAVLHYLIRRVRTGRLMLVATSRPNTWRPNIDAASLEATPIAFSTLVVEPMPRGDCADLLSTILGTEQGPSTPERNALIRAANGYPMALELLAADWQAHGPDCLAIALNAITVDLHHSGHTSRDLYESAVDRLLEELGQASRSVLALASVLGSRVATLGSFRILDLTLGQAVAGISELSSRRILRDVGSGLEFANELVRAHVYRRIPVALRATLHAAVAELGTSGQLQIPTIELAWHLMRSGRPHEASEALLRGASEALLHGAPDEAVLALSGSLGSIPDSDLAGATRLLIEGLHELGRWLDVVKTADRLVENERTPFIRALVIEARWRLGIDGHNRLRQAVRDLLDLVDQEVDRPGKLLATAASIAGSLRDAELVFEVERKARAATAASPRQRALIRTTQAIAAYYTQEAEAAERFAGEAMEDLASTNSADSVVAQLEIGIGIINSARGRYLPALEHQLRAHSVGQKLGNSQLAMRAASNACFAALRLGRTQQVLRLARRFRLTPEDVRSHSIRVNVMNLAYSEACALVLEGQADLALRRMEEGDITALVDHDQDWHRQVWHLYRADVLWLGGHRSKARREAATIIFDGSQPMTSAVVGGFCRWTAILMRTRPAAESLFRVVRESWESRSRLDAVDRLEVANAALETGQWRTADERTEMETEARSLTAELPPATAVFLEHFGPAAPSGVGARTTISQAEQH